MTEFEEKVLSELAEIKADLRWILGNGKPGLLRDLQDRVEHHERYVQRAGGIGAVLAIVLTIVHLGIDWLRFHMDR